MKIKYSFFTLLAFIVVGCSEPDPMKEIYIQDCNADGATTETCSCLYDYGKKNMSERAFMSSDFTETYRNKNNILKPGFKIRECDGCVTEIVQIEEYMVDPTCTLGMCPLIPNPDYQKPPSQETIAMITTNAMDACF